MRGYIWISETMLFPSLFCSAHRSADYLKVLFSAGTKVEEWLTWAWEVFSETGLLFSSADEGFIMFCVSCKTPSTHITSSKEKLLGLHSHGLLVYGSSKSVIFTLASTILVLPSLKHHQKSANEVKLSLFELTVVVKDIIFAGLQKHLRREAQ